MNETQNQLFFTLGEMSGDGYFIYNSTTKSFGYLNHAFAEIWETSREIIRKHPAVLLQLIQGEDRDHAVSCYEEVINDGKEKKYELKLLFSDGREKYVRFVVSPLTEGDDVLLCGTLEDITVTKHNKIHIEQINAHKNITLEVLSHDLKEPLGMLKMTASSMENGIAETGDLAMIDSLQFIKDLCERNIRLVRSMVNHEFLKSAIVEIKKERADLVAELHDVVRFYRRSHLRHIKHFRFSSTTEKIFINIDSMKFLQVINNLISNSIKFTADFGIISVDVKDKPKSVVVSVSDNGIGIPEELKDRIFEAGSQGLRLGLKGEESHGLGMAIIKSIVELHHGRVWFESEVGEGSIFCIELPK